MLLRSLLVKEWHRTLTLLGVSNPTRAVNMVFRHLWEGIVLSLWEVRNDILHRHENLVKKAEDNTLNATPSTI